MIRAMPTIPKVGSERPNMLDHRYASLSTFTGLTENGSTQILLYLQ